MVDIEGIKLLNTTISSGSWVNEAAEGATPTYEDFPYKTEILVSGVTSYFSADVRFSYSDIISGLVPPFAKCGTNKIMLYASEIPEYNMVVPIIMCTKLV